MTVSIYCRPSAAHSFSLPSLHSGGTTMLAMPKPTSLLFFVLSSIILLSVIIPANGFEASSLLPTGKEPNPAKPNQGETQPEGLRGIKGWNNRRLMIGSTAPTCSYNECRGCRFSCSAEQVPVDANDPINSAYHYRCVCHRRE